MSTLESQLYCRNMTTMKNLNVMQKDIELIQLFKQVRQCRLCEPQLPLGARPIIRGSAESKLLIIGQAPGTRVHASGIPWDDPSGDRLRAWLQMDKANFYDENKIAIMPMGFCYPGKGSSGDLPPRTECAPLWHQQILTEMPAIKLILLIGQYAQNYYLPEKKQTLTARVKNWQQYLPEFIVLPHPSPRNNIWLRKNPWFEQELLPEMQQRVSELFNG